MTPSNDEAIAYVTSMDKEGREDVKGREQILIKIKIQIEKLDKLIRKHSHDK